MSTDQTAADPTERTATAEPPESPDGETDVEGRADRPPTDQESRDAEVAANDVDLDEVRERFRDMGEIGAHVKGEGRIG